MEVGSVELSIKETVEESTAVNAVVAADCSEVDNDELLREESACPCSPICPKE